MAEHDPHDPAQVKENQEKQKLLEIRKVEDMKWVLSTEQGRRVIWDLLSFCGIFRSSFTGNSTTFFNEGGRNVGLRLYNQVLTADEIAYLKMRKEAQGEQ